MGKVTVVWSAELMERNVKQRRLSGTFHGPCRERVGRRPSQERRMRLEDPTQEW